MPMKTTAPQKCNVRILRIGRQPCSRHIFLFCTYRGDIPPTLLRPTQGAHRTQFLRILAAQFLLHALIKASNVDDHSPMSAVADRFLLVTRFDAKLERPYIDRD